MVGSTKHVKIIVFVDKESARVMNSGEEKLEDILVLHLEGGKDFFVSFSFLFLSVLVGRDTPVLRVIFVEFVSAGRIWLHLCSADHGFKRLKSMLPGTFLGILMWLASRSAATPRERKYSSTEVM